MFVFNDNEMNFKDKQIREFKYFESGGEKLKKSSMDVSVY